MVTAKQEENGLNEHHLRRLLVTCQYIDGLLVEIENLLHSSACTAAFPRYFLDISATERPVIEAYISRTREQLLQLASRHGLHPQPSIPARHAIHSILAAIRISAEELQPRYLKGYGEVPARAAARLQPLVRKLQDTVAELDSHIAKKENAVAEPHPPEAGK
jgi:hypothetical protein